MEEHDKLDLNKHLIIISNI